MVSTPTYLRIADDIRARILDGRLVVGDRLPSERAAAGRLVASRTTVAAAYGLLRAEGFLVSRQGSGTVAALPSVRVDRPDETGADTPVDIDLTTAALAAPAQLATLAAGALEEFTPLLSGPGLHPLGLRPLREQIARYYTDRGLPTGAEQVLVTQGALHGWSLVLRALAAPGQRVLIEQPTYAGGVDAAIGAGLRVSPLAVDADGWTLPTRTAAALAHVTPDHQNPTGHHATRAERRALLQRLEARVVVDETFSDLGHPGSRVEPPMATLSRTAITLGSLSKSVWAGLRVGWVRADAQTVRRLSELRGGQDLATPVFDQLLALACLRDLPAITAERARMLARRSLDAQRVVARVAPHWSVRAPTGGMVLWIELGDSSSTQLAATARTLGVRVAPGPRYAATGTHDRFLRLPLMHPEAVTADALERLARAEHLPPRRRPRTPSWTA